LIYAGWLIPLWLKGNRFFYGNAYAIEDMEGWQNAVAVGLEISLIGRAFGCGEV
jgi:hypothetical protein